MVIVQCAQMSEYRLKQKVFLGVGVLLVIMLVVSGCASGATPEAVVTPTAPAPVIQVQTVIVPTPMPSATPDLLADPLLLLVNRSHPLAGDFPISLVEVENGWQVDERMAEDLGRLLADMRDAGWRPYISSAYRSYQAQQELFDATVAYYTERGETAESARAKALALVAQAGTSEHQSGLVVDIGDDDNPEMSVALADTAFYKWLAENSWRYGFILRFPRGSTEVTGFAFEPWHFRFVGQDHARSIYERGLLLEQYLDVIP